MIVTPVSSGGTLCTWIAVAAIADAPKLSVAMAITSYVPGKAVLKCSIDPV